MYFITLPSQSEHIRSPEMHDFKTMEEVNRFILNCGRPVASMQLYKAERLTIGLDIK